MTGIRPAVIRLGTRRSALATAQSSSVARGVERLAAASSDPVRVELVEVSTTGDESSAPLTSFGGAGVFVSRLREALLAGEVDVAVHSLKDLPTAAADGVLLAAVPRREDPRDVLVARDGLRLNELPAGSRVGTGSPRRAAQLRVLGRELGRDLEVVGVRGNVDTRIGRVAGSVASSRPGSSDLDAVVLAMAGLVRLGRGGEATDVFEPQAMLPAPGQGALAVECRSGDAELAALLAGADHPVTRAAVEAERALLAALEAGCSAPLGALAEVQDGEHDGMLRLRALVASLDGTRVLRREATGSLHDPSGLGVLLAAELLAVGAADLVGAVRTPTREGAS